MPRKLAIAFTNEQKCSYINGTTLNTCDLYNICLCLSSEKHIVINVIFQKICDYKMFILPACILKFVSFNTADKENTYLFSGYKTIVINKIIFRSNPVWISYDNMVTLETGSYLFVYATLHCIQLGWGSWTLCFHGNSCQIGFLLVVESNVHLIHEPRGHAMCLGHDIPRHIGVKWYCQQVQHWLQASEVIELGVSRPGKTELPLHHNVD